MIFLSEDELLPIITKRIQVISREDAIIVEKLLPIWQAVALGGVLKLVKNRIRFNALMNFLKIKVDSNESEHILEAITSNDSLINHYGESLIGVLFPDKKSAIAIGISQKMQCKSSLVLKGLTFVLGTLALQLKQEEEKIADFSSFCSYISSYKQQFSTLIFSDIQKIIIEILLLNDVLKSDSTFDFSVSLDEPEEEESRFSGFVNSKIVIVLVVVLLLGGLGYYFTSFNQQNTVELDETDDIIPIDSLNKLNDSLTQVAVDSTKLLADSLVSLSWNSGKMFSVPRQSSIVTLHSFLSDSTNKEPIQLTSFEVSFDNESDQIIHSKDYFFKRFTEGLQLYKDVKIEIVAFSEKDSKSALKRGFYLKNRLVGEGVSPKRISVLPSISGVNPDASFPLQSQVVFRIIK